MFTTTQWNVVFQRCAAKTSYGVFARASMDEGSRLQVVMTRAPISSSSRQLQPTVLLVVLSMIDIIPDEPRSTLIDEPGSFASEHICEVSTVTAGLCYYRLHDGRTERTEPHNTLQLRQLVCKPDFGKCGSTVTVELEQRDQVKRRITDSISRG
jgi:hypothetical protein